MPLIMGGVSTARPQLVSWDPDAAPQCRDATVRIDQLLAEGFVLDFARRGEARLLPPGRSPHQILFRILTDNGDDRLVWDRRVASEVEDAAQRFRDLLARGYRAFCAKANGLKGHAIELFDPSLEEIIMVPATRVFPG